VKFSLYLVAVVIDLYSFEEAGFAITSPLAGEVDQASAWAGEG